MESKDLIPHLVTASVQGIPLLLVVIGLVRFVKSLGVSGNGLRVSSMGIGVVLGTGYQVAVLPGPLAPDPLAAYGVIFAILFYGLAVGIVASLVYDAAGDLIEKALSRLNAPAAR